jgi:hypothetical protein
MPLSQPYTKISEIYSKKVAEIFGCFRNLLYLCNRNGNHNGDKSSKKNGKTKEQT